MAHPESTRDLDPRDERHQMTVPYTGPAFSAVGAIGDDVVTADSARGELSIDARLLVRARALTESASETSDYPPTLLEDFLTVRAVIAAFDRLIRFELKPEPDQG